VRQPVLRIAKDRLCFGTVVEREPDGEELEAVRDEKAYLVVIADGGC
jgi:hypothetical protein